MKLIYFISAAFKESLNTIIIGIAAFVVTLVLTLNFTAALLSLVLVFSIAIFDKSFSRGWLFLLGIILLFPSTRISNANFNLQDILLSVLAVIGLVNILVLEAKIKFNNLSYPFFLLGLIGLSYVVFGMIFNFTLAPEIVVSTFFMIMYLIIMVTFQYFFQTQKRLRRFFMLIVTIALIHSVFGIMAFIFGFQTPTGLGISTGAIPYFSGHSVMHQINGFLGDGYILRVGENALAPFLLISIPLTMALFVNQKRNKIFRTFSALGSRQREYTLLDSIHTLGQKIYFQQLVQKTKIQKLLEWLEIVNQSTFLLFLLIVFQAIALVLTFDYLAMVVLSFAVFVFGVLLRKKQIITISTISIVILTIIVPNIQGSLLALSENNFFTWFNGFNQIKDYWIWGAGWNMIQESEKMAGINSHIFNSYLYIWNIFGLIGLITFLAILVRYFWDLRSAYLESDGTERIWLIAILVIFFEMVILGISSNTLLFGPAALIFWMLYVAAVNLKKRKIVFGLTESKLQK